MGGMPSRNLSNDVCAVCGQKIFVDVDEEGSLRTPTSSPVTTCILNFPLNLVCLCFFLTGNMFYCYIGKKSMFECLANLIDISI